MKNSRLAILNVVGLTRSLFEDMPRLQAWMAGGEISWRNVQPVLPAVTSTVQASWLTGKAPGEHGIVANGWYDRERAEHLFWKQSDHFVQGEKIWETLRQERPGFTCARLFWWNNMYSSVDYSITPRPIYCADGNKVFDISSHPLSIRDQIKKDLGPFPFPAFWGPASGIASSEWIARSARWMEEKHAPDLNLVYLPHLDYNFQKLGPEDPAVKADVEAIDRVVGDLIDFLESRGVDVLVLSEYGITPVDRPVHLNREFRKQGWLEIKDELGRDTLELGDSRAFAIADHQIAHVYVNDSSMKDDVRRVLEETEGVEQVLEGEAMEAAGLAHARSGDLVAVADARSWFTYYFWEDDDLAPDYARTVDIHRKPGYDPVELFLDPEIRFPKLKLGWRLLQKKLLRQRTLFDVIPLDASLVKGSHGRIPEDPADWPVMVGREVGDDSSEVLPATNVHEWIKSRFLA